MRKYILHSILLIFTAIAFISCGDDKDEPAPENQPYNAEGLYVEYDREGAYPENCYFWINNYIIKGISYNKYEAPISMNRNYKYEPLTMDAVYGWLSDSYGQTIDENTDLNNYPDEKKFVRYMKSACNKYDYAAFNVGNGNVYVFNRISDTNY